MNKLRLSIGSYRTVVTALCSLGIGFLFTNLDSRVINLNLVVLLVVLASVAELWPLELPRYGKISMADPVCYAAALLSGPRLAMVCALGAGSGRFAREAYTRFQGKSFQEINPLFVSYSVSLHMFSYGIGGFCYHYFSKLYSVDLFHGPDIFQMLGGAGLLVMFAGVTSGIQIAFCAVHKWLEQGRIGVVSSRLNWSRVRLALLAGVPLGLVIAQAFCLNAVVVLLLLPSLVFTYYSIRSYTQILREAREVIIDLAQAVERRDPVIAGHSERVARYAAGIARQMGVDEQLVGRVETAGRLHDLGKISVEDSVLHKSGQLSGADFQQIQRHPEVGAKVAQRISLSREEAQYIMYHHEWYNGWGYPRGLKGEEIPLGARILAVAEAYDTLLTPQRYRAPLTPKEALRKLQESGGTQFDPRVVEALSRTIDHNTRLIAGRSFEQAEAV